MNARARHEKQVDFPRMGMHRGIDSVHSAAPRCRALKPGGRRACGRGAARVVSCRHLRVPSWPDKFVNCVNRWTLDPGGAGAREPPQPRPPGWWRGVVLVRYPSFVDKAFPAAVARRITPTPCSLAGSFRPTIPGAC